MVPLIPTSGAEETMRESETGYILRPGRAYRRSHSTESNDRAPLSATHTRVPSLEGAGDEGTTLA